MEERVGLGIHQESGLGLVQFNESAEESCGSAQWATDEGGLELGETGSAGEVWKSSAKRGDEEL